MSAEALRCVLSDRHEAGGPSERVVPPCPSGRQPAPTEGSAQVICGSLGPADWPAGQVIGAGIRAPAKRLSLSARRNEPHVGHPASPAFQSWPGFPRSETSLTACTHRDTVESHIVVKRGFCCYALWCSDSLWCAISLGHFLQRFVRNSTIDHRSSIALNCYQRTRRHNPYPQILESIESVSESITSRS